MVFRHNAHLGALAARRGLLLCAQSAAGSPIFEATLGNPSVEGSLPPLEPDPLCPLASLRSLVALAARLPRARPYAPPHALPVSPGPLVWRKVVEPQRRRERDGGSGSRAAKPAEGRR